ncbi:MAG TPA: cupredoxin domain-containing protein [Gemmatimonadales bacterium]
MSAAQIAVTLAGLAAIAWVNWYFFLAGRGEAVAVAADQGVQRARIVVRGGYTPATVRVRAGRPVRLEFDRQETSGCTEEVVLPDFGIRTYLPAHQTTPVEFTPQRPGSYEFTCGMAMVRGRILVEEK